MNYKGYLISLCLGVTSILQAQICPHPLTSSLYSGKVPPDWYINPFSNETPQAGIADFARANILVAGYGQGIMCTYRQRGSEYSIWQTGRVKLPSRLSPYWVETLGGYACSMSLDDCVFTML